MIDARSKGLLISRRILLTPFFVSFIYHYMSPVLLILSAGLGTQQEGVTYIRTYPWILHCRWAVVAHHIIHSSSASACCCPVWAHVTTAACCCPVWTHVTTASSSSVHNIWALGTKTIHRQIDRWVFFLFSRSFSFFFFVLRRMTRTAPHLHEYS